MSPPLGPGPAAPPPRRVPDPFEFVEDPFAPRHVGPPRLTFSRVEVLHLAGAVIALTFCVGLVIPAHGSQLPLLRLGQCDPGTVPCVLIPSPLGLLAAFFAVSSGFIFHELAHKVVAQRYGHWAEFRAQFGQLGLAYALVAFTGILFAAPGAVHILGRVTPRENGLISLVGPGTNLVIALASWPLAWSVNPDDTVPFIFGVVAFANALLCVFNLIPLGPLDGRKVLRWSKAVYFPSLVAAAAVLVMMFFWRNGPPL